MSKHTTQVKEVSILKGNICKVVLHLERPSRTTVNDRIVMEETNRWVYIGTQDDWLSEDGANLAPPEHVSLLNAGAKLFLLRERYKTWITKR